MNQRRDPVFTFHASEFYDKPLVVWNEAEQPSFVDVGAERFTLAAGEERSFDVPRGVDYQIGLGPKVRLSQTKQEVLKR